MSCSWCLTTLAQHHVFNPHSFEENPPTVCWVKNVKSKRGPDDVLAADYPTYCTSILQAAMLSFDWTTDPRLTPVGMLRVWPALTSRLPHAAPRLGSCNYVEAKRERASFQTHTHTHPYVWYADTQRLTLKDRDKSINRDTHSCIIQTFRGMNKPT